MITRVVVTYRVRPEAVAEYVRLIEAVFAQLQTESPPATVIGYYYAAAQLPGTR